MSPSSLMEISPNSLEGARSSMIHMSQGNKRIWYNKLVNPIISLSVLLRYVGSRVSDFHRTLIYGGILIYPQKEVNIYEAFCLSYLIDKAWDRSSCGQEG